MNAVACRLEGDPCLVADAVRCLDDVLLLTAKDPCQTNAVAFLEADDLFQIETGAGRLKDPVFGLEDDAECLADAVERLEDPVFPLAAPAFVSTCSARAISCVATRLPGAEISKRRGGSDG